MKVKNIILSILVLLINSVSFAQNESGKMEVMMKILTLKNALVAKDSVALSNVLADDVTYGHTNAMMQTKTELIRDVVSLVQDYKSIEPSNINIRIYNQTAIVNMDSKLVMNYKNQPLNMDMRITLVWIKIKNDWQLVARQSVKVS